MALLDSFAAVHAVCWLCFSSCSMLLAIINNDSRPVSCSFFDLLLLLLLLLLLFVLMLVLPLVLVIVMVLAFGRAAAVRSLISWFLIGLFLQEFVEKLHSQNILSEGAILCGADRICAPEYKMAPKMERTWADLVSHVEFAPNTSWNTNFEKFSLKQMLLETVLGLCQVHQQQRA